MSSQNGDRKINHQNWLPRSALLEYDVFRESTLKIIKIVFSWGIILNLWFYIDMTEIINSNQNTPEPQPAKPVRTLEALLDLYNQGHRNFSGSDLRGVTLKTIKIEVLEKPQITFLNLREVILTGSNLTAAIFKESFPRNIRVDLTGANLQDCNLRLADFSECQLDQCDFSNSDLSGADLTGSSCRGSDFIKAVFQNIKTSRISDFTASDFTEANFSSSTISFGIFTAANFTRTNLRSVKSLERSTSFRASNFSGANLHSARLGGDFSQSNFYMAILCDATFYCFDVQWADFSNADLRISKVDGGVFKYSYYNSKTKFSDCLDPVASGMELIEDESGSEE